MTCQFCGAKRRSNQSFCEFCGGQFPRPQQAPPPPTSHRSSNIGSTLSGSQEATYRTTETFGRGSTPSKQGSKSAGGFFIVLIFLIPFIIGFISVIGTVVGNKGGFVPTEQNQNSGSLRATLVSGTTKASWSLDIAHNTVRVTFTGQIKNTGVGNIPSVVIYFDLRDGDTTSGVYYKTVHIIVYELAPGETRDFSQTVHTHNNIRPTGFRFNRTDCHKTILYPERGEIKVWNIQLNPSMRQATYNVSIHNHSNTTIGAATVRIRLMRYDSLGAIGVRGTQVGYFEITITDIPPGEERMASATISIPPGGTIDTSTAVTLQSISFI